MDKKEALELYSQMVIIRRLEEKSAELYQQGKIGGFLHLYIGQEAVSTGLLSVRKDDDRVITAYRDHGVAINMGISPNEIIAEFLGKSTGVSRGKGGSMHLADVSKNFFGGHAIVGAHLPLAAGLALADQYKENESITICMFGDGSTNIGYFHEALNLSKVWNLPVLWVCENNKYGMGTAVERSSAASNIMTKARGYEMDAQQVDGMNIIKVRETASKMMDEIRSGSGPKLLEIVTYRYVGHSMGDPERYRSQDEVIKWREDDPIGIFRKYILSEKISTEEELDQLEDDADRIISEAVQFAESSPEPEPEELYSHIYFEKEGEGL